jgi:HK97 gp10 family phage protein
VAKDVDLRLDGDRQLKRLIQELPKRVVKKGLRQAATAGGQPIVRAVKNAAPVDSGTLKKSIKKKIKTYSSSGNVIAVIGADRAASAIIDNKKHVPANYIHLIEAGHGGPAPAPPHPFLTSAYQNTKATALQIATNKLREVLEREASNLR